MPVSVPTMDEFSALEVRVRTLEGEAPPASEGTLARRITDLIELFGVNTFSSLDTNNSWGSWPADYRPETVNAALSYLTGDSGFRLRLREYHFADRTDMQREWFQAIEQDAGITICPGANAKVSDVSTMLSLWNDPTCGLTWLEGINEPNTDFGSGQVPVATTVAIQQEIWNSADADVMGPSIVAGMPHPEGWIEGYCGGYLSEINGMLNFANGHYYPPHCPDLTGDGTSISEYVGGLWTAYGQHAVMLTEFHPTLYNSEGNGPSQPGWDGTRDAYYTLLALFRASKIGVTGLWWYALFDYGTTYRCGLFPKNTDNPRPAADAIRNLCKICGPVGSRDFTPGKLEVGVSGSADWGLYQRSDGTFILTLWRAAPERNGGGVAVVNVTLKSEAEITEWSVIDDRLIQQQRGSEITSQLSADVRVITIKH